MNVIQDIIERRVNSTGVSEPVVVSPGHRPGRRRAAGRARTRRPIEKLVGQTGRLDFVAARARRPERRPGRSRRLDLHAPSPRRRCSAATRSTAASPATDQTGGRAVDFKLKDAGREAVRRLHRGQRRRLLRDRPRRQGHLGAGHQDADPQRPGPDHRRRHRRLRAHGGQRTSSRSSSSARCRSRSQELTQRPDQRDARRAVPAPEPDRRA